MLCLFPVLPPQQFYVTSTLPLLSFCHSVTVSFHHFNSISRWYTCVVWEEKLITFSHLHQHTPSILSALVPVVYLKTKLWNRPSNGLGLTYQALIRFESHSMLCKQWYERLHASFSHISLLIKQMGLIEITCQKMNHENSPSHRES